MATASMIVLSGCAAAPDYDLPRDDAGPTLDSVTRRIMCELADMVVDRGPASYGHRRLLLQGDFDVELQLNLTVNDFGGLAPSFTYMSGPFSFNAGATLSGSREQNYLQYLHFSMRELAQEVQDVPSIAQCSAYYDTNLAGEIGLRQAVDLALTAQGADLTPKLSGTSGAFGGYASFVVTKNLNMVGPTWLLKHFKLPGSLASVSQVNTDKVFFGFAEGPNVGKPFTVFSSKRNERAEHILDQLSINQLSTQLSGIRNALQ